jgi:hypothetical protein
LDPTPGLTIYLYWRIWIGKGMEPRCNGLAADKRINGR